MMPLTLLAPGNVATVRKVGGLDDTRRFLENLGFTEGAEVTAVSTMDGNMIVKIRDARVAINMDMAKKIMV
jgi:ferrous iron transport protein A